MKTDKERLDALELALRHVAIAAEARVEAHPEWSPVAVAFRVLIKHIDGDL